jgi:hypothetical protein
LCDVVTVPARQRDGQGDSAGIDEQMVL